jgi:hypothetical protein
LFVAEVERPSAASTVEVGSLAEGACVPSSIPSAGEPAPLIWVTSPSSPGLSTRTPTFTFVTSDGEVLPTEGWLALVWLTAPSFPALPTRTETLTLGASGGDPASPALAAVDALF